jgi:hypothetical protein
MGTCQKRVFKHNQIRVADFVRLMEQYMAQVYPHARKSRISSADWTRMHPSLPLDEREPGSAAYVFDVKDTANPQRNRCMRVYWQGVSCKVDGYDPQNRFFERGVNEKNVDGFIAGLWAFMDKSGALAHKPESIRVGDTLFLNDEHGEYLGMGTVVGDEHEFLDVQYTDRLGGTQRRKVSRRKIGHYCLES